MIRRHQCWLTAILMIGTLAACGSEVTRHGVPLTEKTVFGALKAVHASDEQRGTILGAFEDARPKLAACRDQADDYRDQILKLSPHDANYLAQADALATKLADVTAQETRIQARFVHDVAGALSDRQWDEWLAYFRRVELPQWDRPDDRYQRTQ